MIFAEGSVSVATGRISSADYADGTVRVVISDGCALKLYEYDTVGRIKRGGSAVSYSDDCALVGDGKIERRDGLYYVST